jgi:hypothetical protein
MVQEELIIEEETVPEEERSEQASPNDIWIYERYIYGILESFQALPLERIHKLLKARKRPPFLLQRLNTTFRYSSLIHVTTRPNMN